MFPGRLCVLLCLRPDPSQSIAATKRASTCCGSRSKSRSIVPLKYIEHGVYGDPIITYPKPYSIYLRGTLIGVGAEVGIEVEDA